MKRTITIIGTIFVLLLLIFSSMPGVQAVSSQAPESGVKISALLSLQVEAKLRAVEAGGGDTGVRSVGRGAC